MAGGLQSCYVPEDHEEGEIILNLESFSPGLPNHY